jgi:hypothetical protein
MLWENGDAKFNIKSCTGISISINMSLGGDSKSVTERW